MAEHNFGTLCSLLIIFSFTKFVSQNSLKMKAKFLVGKSQYQWFFPLSRKKDPTDSCQTGFNWNICGSQMAYPQPQQKRILEAVPQPSVPTLCLSHAAWGSGNDGIPWLSSPGVRALLGHPGQSVSLVQCQLPVALTLPVPSSFPPSSCVSDTSWLALAAEDHSFSRSSGWLSGSPFFCPKDNHPKMIGALQFCQLVWNCP